MSARELPLDFLLNTSIFRNIQEALVILALNRYSPVPPLERSPQSMTDLMTNQKVIHILRDV